MNERQQVAAVTTIAQAVRVGAARLDGIAESPGLESRILLAHALGLTRNDLIRDATRPVDTAAFEALLGRRTAREPLALIVGRREFWSMDFQVSAATLVPRPDSETLIEAAVSAFASRPAPARILDLGTGTGCLVLALLQEFPSAFGIGIDLRPDAAALAKSNAVRNGLADRVAFCVDDWARSLSGRFDLIICNPPYIPSQDIAALMPEVALHEPRLALDGGVDGFDAYRAIIPSLPHHLEQDGVAILEIGVRQGTQVAGMAQAADFDVSLCLDLAQVPRAMVLTRPNRRNKVWQSARTGLQ
jgi:release factor glutamine methyltransferase